MTWAWKGASFIILTDVGTNLLVGATCCICSDGTLVVLISYAGSEQETAAMALDQYGGFGMGTPVPRRIYSLVRLSARGGVAKHEGGSGIKGMIEGVGGSMKIEGVTGVPYATVSTLSFGSSST